jgi:hypothetical protein
VVNYLKESQRWHSVASEFQEIGHCGGQFTVRVETVDGQRGFALGFRGSRPVPMSAFGIYALPQGIPVGMMDLSRGVGVPFNPPPTADSLEIFVASDTEGSFGHQCPTCNGYWRSKAVPWNWPITCPYCGVRAATHYCLTEGQERYVRACCELIQKAIHSDADGEYIINMDEVADAVGKDIEKPKFYYAEQSQQNKFKCDACSSFNDILGRYGYCSCCGTHNGFSELNKDIDRIRERIKTGSGYEASVKEAVAAFDSFARQFAQQFARRIPMTPARKKFWEGVLFHQLESRGESLEQVFGIKLIKNVSEDDVRFAKLMFHRRHVYEHNGGEVDQKYLDDSGDNSVRLKQVLYESQESAFRITNIILKLGQNFHEGFHLIFPPEQKALTVLGRSKTPV